VPKFSAGVRFVTPLFRTGLTVSAPICGMWSGGLPLRPAISPYSRAMRDFAWHGHVWGFCHPECLFGGTGTTCSRYRSMSFAALRNEQERADVLLYLNSLSDQPTALPPVEKAQNNGVPE